MSDKDFYITFRGEVCSGWDTGQARRSMAHLFRLDTNNPDDSRKLARLFSGQRIILKTGLDWQTAQAYIELIAKAGGEAHIGVEDSPPAGMPERRVAQRRKRGDRRRRPRASAVIPDRRKITRRRSDQLKEQ